MLTFIPQEQAICDRCQSVIPTDNILSKVNETNGIQSIEAGCCHCHTLYSLERQLNGGVWQIVGGVTEVTNAARKARFAKRIAAKRGDLQLATA